MTTSSTQEKVIIQFVGRKVRQARKDANLSMEEVAERLGVSYQQLQKYEAGTNRISASKLFFLSCLLKLPLSFFFPRNFVD